MRNTELARFCLDASFVIALLLRLPIQRAAIRRWKAITPADDVHAPLWLLAECTSVLSESAYRRDISVREARRLVETAVSMPVRLAHAPALYPRAFDIARALGWAKAYDALYLATAEHEDAELLTVDRRMRDAARRLGIRATLVR